MLGEIDYPQLVEWMEFDRMHPIGEVRGDWQAGSISSSLANVLAALHGSDKRWKPSDFILRWKDPDDPDQPDAVEKESPEAKVARFKFIGQMMAAAANADEERKKTKRTKRKR